MAVLPIALAERIEGGLLGLLIGDALGVPYEFHQPHQIPPASEIDFLPPPGFSASHAGVPRGTWSDDGAQALCLLASLLEFDSLNLKDFAQKLVEWYCQGRFTPDGVAFDCGLQTRRAIQSLVRGVEPDVSGPREEGDNGNGSLMRVLPLALFHSGSDQLLVLDAHRQSAVTHGHPRSQVCCAFFCLWARELLNGRPDGWSGTGETLATIYAQTPDATAELEFILDPSHRSLARGSGYVLDTLWSARIALEESNYQAVVRAAVRMGNDTDTTACVAGGLAGIRDGIRSIPEAWQAGLRGAPIYKPLLSRLLRQRASSASRSAQTGSIVSSE
jgi:ADP-ribosyl-[dinitrogen reductase] hydrolase